MQINAIHWPRLNILNQVAVYNLEDADTILCNDIDIFLIQSFIYSYKHWHIQLLEKS